MDRDERQGSGRPVPPPLFSRATDWLVVSCVGAIVFAISVYKPATAWIGGPKLYGTDWVTLGIAVVGGVVWMFGFSKWYDNRPGSRSARRRPPTRVDMSRASNLSSFHVYRPPPEGSEGSNKPKV
jgi:hypothetical protein